MDDDTRAAFGRMDRYFELAQVQHAEVRADFGELRADFGELRADFGELRAEVGLMGKRLAGVEDRLAALEASFRSFRDWVTVQFAELRAAVKQLTVRIEILERRQLR